MSKGCEMCNRTGVVFKPGMPGLDDKDTCPECGGSGIVESVTVPADKRDAAADLAMCDAATPGPWISSSVVIREEILPGEGGHLIAACNQYTLEKSRTNARFIAASREGWPWWIKEGQRLRDVEQDNLTMAADLIAMEGTIKDLRHELTTLKEGTYCAYCGFTVASDADGSVIASHIRTCERHPMRDVETEVARLRTTLASIEEYGTEEINAAFGLRKEINSLNVALNEANDTIERMSHDDEANALDRLRAWRKGCNSRSVFLNDPLLHLCGVDPGGKVVNVFVDAADSASDDPVPADVLMGTQENPAPFAEMVEAALARWADLYGEEQP